MRIYLLKAKTEKFAIWLFLEQIELTPWNGWISQVDSVLTLAAALSVQSPFTNNAFKDSDCVAARRNLDSDHGDPITLLNAYREWLEVSFLNHVTLFASFILKRNTSTVHMFMPWLSSRPPLSYVFNLMICATFKVVPKYVFHLSNRYFLNIFLQTHFITWS